MQDGKSNKKGIKMTTQKIFYEDSYRAVFKAKVISCEVHEAGYQLRLNQTAFYPEGGGQPTDRGWIDGAKVSHVFIKEDIIYHSVDRHFKEGEEVEGVIDFERRLDLMQQHSGEHIVSGLIKKLYGYQNVGFHLSETYMTADLSGELTKEEIKHVEYLANEAIFKNIKVTAALYHQEEIKDRDYRSKIAIEGAIRLVSIQDYDVCACCGTHVKTTGEIGSIKIVGADKHKGGMRLTVLCGRRALQDSVKKQEAITRVSQLLSAKPTLVAEEVEKLLETLAGLKQKLNARTDELFELKASAYTIQEEKVLCVIEEDLSTEEIRKLCMAMTKRTDKTCLVLTPEAEGVKYALGAQSTDIRVLCKELNKAFNGRGGGAKEICQGTLTGTSREIIQRIQNQ
ncbi:MAG: alanyl-tRNA editing protein [Clostridia bacterium]|jgi:alanyl-tRNA synthetase|nr:alanyl-tRNA editing protein [Clostridia bacterium]